MIVVGYAGGSAGRACLEQGIVEATVRDTSMLLISAVSTGRGQRMVDADEIAEVQARLSRSGIKFEIRQPIGADPSEELLRAMDADDADVLVIGMRRRTQVGKLFMGSTSQYLLIECSKPILVVKPNRTAAVPVDAAPGGPTAP
ncbi:universal stress protein [Gordonia sp. MMO-8]|uniref:universal stress protein n=1 Tax=Gordonia sp. MMO-8 TaxID=3127886 RepID=UPI003019230C